MIIYFNSVSFFRFAHDGFGLIQKTTEAQLTGAYYGQNIYSRHHYSYSSESAVKDVDTGIEYQFSGVDRNTVSLRSLFNEPPKQKQKVPQKSNGTSAIYKITYLEHTKVIINAQLVQGVGE